MCSELHIRKIDELWCKEELFFQLAERKIARLEGIGHEPGNLGMLREPPISIEGGDYGGLLSMDSQEGSRCNRFYHSLSTNLFRFRQDRGSKVITGNTTLIPNKGISSAFGRDWCGMLGYCRSK